MGNCGSSSTRMGQLPGTEEVRIVHRYDFGGVCQKDRACTLFATQTLPLRIYSNGPGDQVRDGP